MVLSKLYIIDGFTSQSTVKAEGGVCFETPLIEIACFISCKQQGFEIKKGSGFETNRDNLVGIQFFSKRNVLYKFREKVTAPKNEEVPTCYRKVQVTVSY